MKLILKHAANHKVAMELQYPRQHTVPASGQKAEDETVFLKEENPTRSICQILQQPQL
jgi:hypothetical protein